MVRSKKPENAPNPQSVHRFIRHLIVWAALWWLLTAGHVDSWVIGTPTILAAAVVSVLLSPRRAWRVSPVGILRFIPRFLRASLLGGFDVAWRSLHPRLPIAPQLIEYELRLPDGMARVFFINLVSLLPGTVSVDARDHRLVVHAIDARQPVAEHLSELEDAVGRMFATPVRARESRALR